MHLLDDVVKLTKGNANEVAPALVHNQIQQNLQNLLAAFPFDVTASPDCPARSSGLQEVSRFDEQLRKKTKTSASESRLWSAVGWNGPDVVLVHLGHGALVGVLWLVREKVGPRTTRASQAEKGHDHHPCKAGHLRSWPEGGASFYLELSAHKRLDLDGNADFTPISGLMGQVNRSTTVGHMLTTQHQQRSGERGRDR